MDNEAANNPQQPNTQATVTREVKAFGAETVERSSELASNAVAASARAEVESSYVMAMKNPRHEETARTKILASCRNPGFAVKAKFRKPMGSKEINGRWEPQFVVGPSIRFAEEMLRCWKNVLVQQTAIYDDPVKRIVRITVRDLEANTAYSKEITLDKTVERKSSRDRDVLGQRTNSYGQLVYIVRTTEDELTIKESALASKVIRNNGLRLIPQHIQDEAMAEVDRIVKDKAAKDPEGERRAILDGFAKRGVSPLEIERYLGQPSAQFSGDDLLRLREMLTSIEDGHSTWQEFIEGTPSQATNEIAEKSQVETKGVAINEKLKGVAYERGVELLQETSKKAEPAKLDTPPPAESAAKPEPHAQTSMPASSESQEQGQAAQNDPILPTSPALQATTAPITEDLDALKNRIASAELFLKTRPVGIKKYNSVLSVMKVRLSGKQQPLDVIESTQLPFYCAQLEKAVKSIRETPEKQ